MRPMVLASRSARGTPRRRMPTNPRSATPLLFSMISWASRTRVRSISEADMSCDFSCTLLWRAALGVINEASYAPDVSRGKVRTAWRSLDLILERDCAEVHEGQALAAVWVAGITACLRSFTSRCANFSGRELRLDRVRKLRTEERMAAIARGASMPMEPELSHTARSRRNGILLVSAALGYIVTFALVARVDSDAWVAAAFGVIPLSVGIGFFVDAALLHRDASAV